MTVRTKTDVVIIGGGVIGTSIAYYLAKAGIKATLLERGDICSGTSGACDKAISLQSKNPGLHLELAMESLRMFDTLEEELGCDIEFQQGGGMIAVENERQLEVVKGFVSRQQAHGLPVELLAIEEAVKRQPALSRDLIAATYSPADGEINPLHLTFGFARAAKRLGAIIRTGTEITAIAVHSGRVEGVVTKQGRIPTDIVINAAGVFAPAIGRMAGLEIPIKPRRGQIIVTEAMPPYIHGDLWSARYIVAKYNPEMIREEDPEAADMGVGLSVGQTGEGTLLLGGTREFVGYDTATTDEAVQAILRHAVKILPDLRAMHVIRVFAGLRPYTPDGMPILGPVDGLAGFLMAAGHEGDGIALAPVTGRIMTDYIAKGLEARGIKDLNLRRFAK